MVNNAFQKNIFFFTGLIDKSLDQLLPPLPDLLKENGMLVVSLQQGFLNLILPYVFMKTWEKKM